MQGTDGYQHWDFSMHLRALISRKFSLLVSIKAETLDNAGKEVIKIPGNYCLLEEVYLHKK